jgi:hypothetical protein
MWVALWVNEIRCRWAVGVGSSVAGMELEAGGYGD